MTETSARTQFAAPEWLPWRVGNWRRAVVPVLVVLFTWMLGTYTFLAANNAFRLLPNIYAADLIARVIPLVPLLMICYCSSSQLREQLALSLPADPERRKAIIERTFQFSVIVISILALLAFAARGNLAHKQHAISLDWWLYALSTAVIAPVAEELTFRGYLMGRLLREGFQASICLYLSATLFALLHIELTNLKQSLGTALFAGFAGIVLGIVRLRTTSIYPCIWMHSAWNGAITFAVLVITH